MTDITSPIHNAADVELSELIRQQLAESRGLSPRDYSHYTTRPMAQKKSPDACAAGLKSKE